MVIKCRIPKPLMSKKAKEVAYCLLYIFALFGAPSILQNDNYREFRNQAIDSLKEMRSESTIIHNKLCHIYTQG